MARGINKHEAINAGAMAVILLAILLAGVLL
jgi:hypothetical protein